MQENISRLLMRSSPSTVMAIPRTRSGDRPGHPRLRILTRGLRVKTRMSVPNAQRFIRRRTARPSKVVDARAKPGHDSRYPAACSSLAAAARASSVMVAPASMRAISSRRGVAVERHDARRDPLRARAPPSLAMRKWLDGPRRDLRRVGDGHDLHALARGAPAAGRWRPRPRRRRRCRSRRRRASAPSPGRRAPPSAPA